mmetsp:Transcript_97713/g.314755  ORF Transcript_97713/g.314755 Transcript_97713/m.314755 type:complete len:219 (-) Transcript_97713:490-1146(-)
MGQRGLDQKHQRVSRGGEKGWLLHGVQGLQVLAATNRTVDHHGDGLHTRVELGNLTAIKAQPRELQPAIVGLQPQLATGVVVHDVGLAVLFRRVSLRRRRLLHLCQGCQSLGAQRTLWNEDAGVGALGSHLPCSCHHAVVPSDAWPARKHRKDPSWLARMSIHDVLVAVSHAGGNGDGVADLERDFVLAVLAIGELERRIQVDEDLSAGVPMEGVAFL